jgi:site-specific DNA-methyltransferase (adenine-specific)
MPEPYYQDAHTTMYCGRAEDVLPTLPAQSVNLVVTDPPYFRVKTSYNGEKITWDRQWPTETAYLAWLRGLCREWQRVLKPNGSVYCFASAQMAWAVEGVIREHFNLLTHIVWVKETGNANRRACKEKVRAFLSNTEHILFAEQHDSDAITRGNAGFVAAEIALKKRLFGEPILEGMTGTKTSAHQLTAAIGAYGKVNHGGAVSNWLNGFNVPTKEQYEAMRCYLNSLNGHEYLRQEYEDLRQEYEDLRRPCVLTAQDQYTDVWTFAPVKPGRGKHPCEKPFPLLRHIIKTSSRRGDVVLDCCAGSGATLEAATQLGRNSIGVEMQEVWCQRAVTRLAQAVLPGMFAPAAPLPAPTPLTLFSKEV